MWYQKMHKFVLFLLLFSRVKGEEDILQSFMSNDPPPDSWKDAVRFRHNPACSQRVQMIGLQLQATAIGGDNDRDADARLWFSSYLEQYGKIPDIYNYGCGFFGCTRGHYDLGGSRGNKIDATYVVKKGLSVFFSLQGVRPCSEILGFSGKTGDCAQIISDMDKWQDKQRDYQKKMLQLISLGNCSEKVFEEEGITCYKNIKLQNNFYETDTDGFTLYNAATFGSYGGKRKARESYDDTIGTFWDIISGISVERELVDDGLGGQVYRYGESMADNLYGLAFPAKDLWDLVSVSTSEGGDITSVSDSKVLSNFYRKIAQKCNVKCYDGKDTCPGNCLRWLKGGMPDLRYFGLNLRAKIGGSNPAAIIPVSLAWKWRHMEIFFEGIKQETFEKEFSTYNGYTGCAGGPGQYLKSTDYFHLLSFGETNGGINTSIALVNGNNSKKEMCDFVCRIPGTPQSEYAKVNGLPDPKTIESVYNIVPFVRIYHDSDETLRIGFTQDVSVFTGTSSFNTKSTPTNSLLWNIIGDIEESPESFNGFFWPPSGSYSPLMGANFEDIAVTKRILCKVQGTYFIGENNRIFFGQYENQFIRSLEYILTWAVSTLPDYQQFAKSCDDLKGSFDFPKPYSVLSPMTLKPLDGDPFRDAVLLNQSFFQQCDWSFEALDLPANGTCENTITGSPIFFNECNKSDTNLTGFPIFDPETTSPGWNCFRPTQSTLPNQDNLPANETCPLNERDACSFLGEFRIFSYDESTFPYYDCRLNTSNNAICHGDGIVRENTWRCHDPICLCNPGYHGNRCQYVTQQWNITLSGETWIFDLNYTETTPITYNVTDGVFLGQYGLKVSLGDPTPLGAPCLATNDGVVVKVVFDPGQTWEILNQSVREHKYNAQESIMLYLNGTNISCSGLPSQVEVLHVERFPPVSPVPPPPPTIPPRTTVTFTSTTSTPFEPFPNASTITTTTEPVTESTTTTFVPVVRSNPEEEPVCSVVILPLTLTTGCVLGIIAALYVGIRKNKKDALLYFFVFTSLGMVISWLGVRSCEVRRDEFIKAIDTKTLHIKTSFVPAMQFKAGKHVAMVPLGKLYSKKDVFSKEVVPYVGPALERRPNAAKGYVKPNQFHSVPYLGSISRPVEETFCRKRGTGISKLPTSTPFQNELTSFSDDFCRQRTNGGWLGFYCATNSSTYIYHCFTSKDILKFF
jgi:hypothetical protein